MFAFELAVFIDSVPVSESTPHDWSSLLLQPLGLNIVLFNRVDWSILLFSCAENVVVVYVFSRLCENMLGWIAICGF